MDFEKSLVEGTIIQKHGYNYLVNPLGDGIPEINPIVLDEVLEVMEEIIEHFHNVDKIVTMEAMGIPLATGLSLRMGLPFNIIRKRQYNLDGEKIIRVATGYSENFMFINGLNKGDKVVIVDVLFSTGGTLDAVLQALKEKDVEVLGVIIAISKSNKKLLDMIKKWDIPIYSLSTIDVNEGKVKLLK
jgi:adenine phosphoribosyltransferase